MYKLKRLAPFIVVLAVGYLLFSSWNSTDTFELSRATACGASCSDDGPESTDKNPFVHKYAWRIGGGTVSVTCRRSLFVLGRWTCKADQDAPGAVEARDDMTHYPHETPRGQQ